MCCAHIRTDSGAGYIPEQRTDQPPTPGKKAVRKTCATTQTAPDTWRPTPLPSRRTAVPVSRQAGTARGSTTQASRKPSRRQAVHPKPGAGDRGDRGPLSPGLGSTSRPAPARAKWCSAIEKRTAPGHKRRCRRETERSPKPTPGTAGPARRQASK